MELHPVCNRVIPESIVIGNFGCKHSNLRIRHFVRTHRKRIMNGTGVKHRVIGPNEDLMECQKHACKPTKNNCEKMLTSFVSLSFLFIYFFFFVIDIFIVGI